MTTKVEVYKGVKLIKGRTEAMIDTIIKKRSIGMGCNELAELVGIADWRSLVGIIKAINSHAPEAEKNTFKNHDGAGKKIARNLIASLILLTKRTHSNILTLPADEWIMEKKILKKKEGYKFTAVERDNETFKRMLVNLNNDPKLCDSIVALEKKTIAEVIETVKPDTYSNAILDYCGFIDSFYNEINDMLNRNLVKKGGFITITLAENDRQLKSRYHVNGYSQRFIDSCCSDEKMNGDLVTTALIKNLVFNNTGYKLVKKLKYKDTQSKMLLFVIQRNFE